MSNRPRTAEGWPRMKVRGQRRRHHGRRVQQVAALQAFLEIDWEAVGDAMASVLDDLARALQTFAESTTKTLIDVQLQGLLPERQLRAELNTEPLLLEETP